MKYNVMVYKVEGRVKIPIITDDGEDEAKKLALEAAKFSVFEKSEKEFIAVIEQAG